MIRPRSSTRDACFGHNGVVRYNTVPVRLLAPPLDHIWTLKRAL